MTHRKHAAALLTAVLLLALTACGRQTAAASDPAQPPAAPAVETPAIAAPAAAPTPAAGKDAGPDEGEIPFRRKTRYGTMGYERGNRPAAGLSS